MPIPTPMSHSPSQRIETQVESIYNSAVQSFVRRDHANTQLSLSRLVALLSERRKAPHRAWYDLESPPTNGHASQSNGDIKPDDLEGWLIKTLKLVISSHASLYADPPSKLITLPSRLHELLPPSTPDAMLDHIHDVCCTTYFTASSPKPRLLPPSLISTLLLASLKLSLPFAHKVAETWLTLLPDSFIFAITPRPHMTNGSADVEEKKRVEGAREGYLKVLELFVGEILAREGEWEMARGCLDGEVVMGSKRKEVSISFGPILVSLALGPGESLGGS